MCNCSLDKNVQVMKKDSSDSLVLLLGRANNKMEKVRSG